MIVSNISSRPGGPGRVTWLAGLLFAAVAGIALGGYLVRRNPSATDSHAAQPLVVYCAHDSIYAEAILRDFERQSGIPVSIRFDTEATKSLGLVNLLIHERERPRCDVFWNNEALGTMDLQSQGILTPYKGAGFERIPAAFKDAEGHWTGFAARMRVYIVNTEKMSATPAAIEQALGGDLSHMALANPLYGTTLTHYSMLWQLWGEERLQAWHQDVRRRGVREVAGNALVKNLVAQGTCDFGWTDTDDFFMAKDEGFPVAAVPITIGDDVPICVPNTVSIIRGTKLPDSAEKLVEFLLSAETETALARSKSRQVPLGPVDPEALPDEVRELLAWVKPGPDPRELERARAECLRWLKSESVK